MIKYKSTRGDKKLYSFSEAILKGIAKDGGLLVPTEIPILTSKQLMSLSNESYKEQANFIINLFEPDLSKEVIRGLWIEPIPRILIHHV